MRELDPKMTLKEMVVAFVAQNPNPKIRFEEGRPPKLEPGMLIRTELGNIYLVGHYNVLGGSCDCCRDLAVQEHHDGEKIIEWAKFLLPDELH